MAEGGLMGKRTVFCGRFQIRDTPCGFEQGTKIIYNDGKVQKVMSTEEFAGTILEHMQFVDSLKKNGGPNVKITVEVKNE